MSPIKIRDRADNRLNTESIPRIVSSEVSLDAENSIEVLTSDRIVIIVEDLFALSPD